MSFARQHIHLICNLGDPSLHALQDGLRLFFEQRAYVTCDLFTTTSDAANYNWRCINACDFIFVLVGNSYGTPNKTGVSQFHISYLNARTTKKPMAAFIHTDGEKPRQLSDLTNTICQQLEHIYPVNEHSDLPFVIANAYKSLSKEKDQQETAPVAKTISIQPIVKNKTKDAPNWQDEVLVSCTAHAFQGGRLIDVAFVATVSWGQILNMLSRLSHFGTKGLWRMLNDLVIPQAVDAVKRSHPEAHAVSRCQVTNADILTIQDTLLQAGWITPVHEGIGRKTWRISDVAAALSRQNKS